MHKKAAWLDFIPGQKCNRPKKIIRQKISAQSLLSLLNGPKRKHANERREKEKQQEKRW